MPGAFLISQTHAIHQCGIPSKFIFFSHKNVIDFTLERL
ncbi:hypothetical protein EH11_00828 [Bacillus subtilis]|jgi:hypothetical protein|nr:hypothetical protein EH11_00828 [Bacillus subtilis]RPK14182.1 hypothetical protein EH5_00807 [Bacillus subtilis]RUS10095.1 hypothetical protein EFW59_00827 [Bacillus subtilis]BAI86918.1 hypothetical protein BSNT_09864 [Bacillus subtilis subsp. natto BEST195]